MPEETSSAQKPALTRKVRQRRTIFITAVVLVVVAAVVVALVFAARDDRSNGGSTADANGDATQVTSPYDLHELPAGTSPGDVGRASLVSISLTDQSGKSEYYGLSADTEEFKALVAAVSGADEVDAADVVTTPLAGTSPGTTTATPTLTFLFPDRGTLAFDLYLKQGIVGRGGDFWRVEGNLETLVQAAVKAAGASQ